MDEQQRQDAIRLIGLTVRGHHGVFDFEKRDGQDFSVDVTLFGDLREPARTDDLADTIDYGTLADDLAAIVAGPPFDLIEALAGALADHCLTVCPEVEVTVHKPQAPISHAFTDVSVTVRRARAAHDLASRPGSWRAVIGLGANLGDALQTLRDAAAALALHPRIDVQSGSSVFVTAPVGGVEQPDFHNAAVVVDTTLPPLELLAVCQGIEVAAGRERTVRWGPRTLDLDIVSVQDATGDVRSDDPTLTLPHPRAGERAFVLAPWAQLQPDAVIQTSHGDVPVSEAQHAAADADGVKCTDDLVWEAERE